MPGIGQLDRICRSHYPTAWLTGVWAGVDSGWDKYTLQAVPYAKRPVHAVLGALLIMIRYHNCFI